MGEDGAPFLDPFAKKAYLIKGKGWVNNHAHVLKSKLNNKFLCYYLNQVDYNGLVTGTTRYKLTQAAMKQILVPTPDLVEQERIVSKIEPLKELRKRSNLVDRLPIYLLNRISLLSWSLRQRTQIQFC